MPRGRPSGSKNKPKTTSLLVAQPVEPSMKLVIINVDRGKDIMQSILNVAHQGCVSLTVLSASGTVTSVTLCNSPNDGGGALMLHGPFTLLSINGSYFYNNNQYNLHSGATRSPPVSFGIHLSTSKGKILGGAIGGNVIAGDDVSITLSTFSHPEIYNCVPKGEEEDDGDKNNNNNNY